MSNNKFKILKTKKQIKFEDTYFTLQNYKEPLEAMRKEEGFGFYGTLLNTLDGEYVQCHICGKLFQNLAMHVKQAHKMTAKEYKEKFHLAFETALIAENLRIANKKRTLKWRNNLTEEQKREWIEKGIQKSKEWRENNVKTQPKQQLETLNKRGTCPMQLLNKIWDVKEELGRVPTSKEFILLTGGQRYKHLIFKTFGSWNKALETLNLQPFTKRRTKDYKFYSNDELLQYLKIFYDTNKIEPTETDALRGLIPATEIYRRRFGSFTTAKQKAEII